MGSFALSGPRRNQDVMKKPLSFIPSKFHSSKKQREEKEKENKRSQC